MLKKKLKEYKSRSKKIDKELQLEEDSVGRVEYSDFEEGKQKPRIKMEN